MAGKSNREILAERPFTLKGFFLRWEWFLVIVFFLVNILGASLTPIYADFGGLLSHTNTFLYSAFLVLPTAFILLIGEIDISVAATAVLSATTLGVAFDKGLPVGVCVLLCLLCGLICGLLNGVILVTFPELPSMIVTFGTQTLFRGISKMIVGTGSVGSGINKSSAVFKSLYNGKIGGVVPIILIIFIILAIIFGVVMHKTTFGRRLYAMGKNKKAAQFSGINTRNIILTVYTLAGIFSAVMAIFMTSRLGTINSDAGLNLEMEAIMMCVLGGILTDGGKGNFVGAVIALFTIGFLKYALSLVNISSYVVTVITGLLLILTVLISKADMRALTMKRKKFSKS